MSQKPRTGDQARPASTTKSPAKEAAAKTEAMARPTAVVSAPAGKAQPAVNPDPVVRAAHVVQTAPTAKVEAAAPNPVANTAAMSMRGQSPTGMRTEPVIAVQATVVTPASSTAATPRIVPAPIVEAPIVTAPTVKAIVDRVAPITAKAVQMATATEPAKRTHIPQLTQGMKSMMKSTEDLSLIHI